MKKSNFPRVMLAAGASGSGKTMITCGILQALQNRNMKVSAFKCGPDYIDPLFHEKVLKTKSRNLDTFFTEEEMTRYLFAKNAAGSDLSVIEGVMGYYDGLGGISTTASAYDLARVTQTPAVLIVNTKGMSLSVLAHIKGFLEYKEKSQIKGVILNRMSPMLYKEMKQMIESELHIRCYGCVPTVEDCFLESRHLGLVLPGEVELLEEKLKKLAGILEETLEIDGLLELAATAPEISGEQLKQGYEQEVKNKEIRAEVLQKNAGETVKIALARDEAFCFIYEDNLQLLREMGAEFIEFSPIHDQKLPEEAQGLLLYGGYPELYAQQLEDNSSMRQDICERLKNGLPCMAECGGFMYLHRTMEDMDREKHQMAGVIDGEVYRTEKLGRFGYIELQSCDASVDLGMIRGHEFHYFDSTNCGESFHAKKPLRKRSWNCIHRTESMMAGFPHLYYYSNPAVAEDFLKKCSGK